MIVGKKWGKNSLYRCAQLISLYLQIRSISCWPPRNHHRELQNYGCRKYAVRRSGKMQNNTTDESAASGVTNSMQFKVAFFVMLYLLQQMPTGAMPPFGQRTCTIWRLGDFRIEESVGTQLSFA